MPKEELREGNYWVITDEEVPGLLLCGKDLEELRADTPNAVALLEKYNA